MRGREKQAPQAFWHCAAPALRLRQSPTASSVAYACSHALTEKPPIRICMRESQAFATEETTR
jgi:hypothetical protein